MLPTRQGYSLGNSLDAFGATRFFASFMPSVTRRWTNQDNADRARTYHAVFGTRSGATVLADILAACGVMQAVRGETEFDRGVAEGKRQAGLMIIQKMGALPLEVRNDDTESAAEAD